MKQKMILKLQKIKILKNKKRLSENYKNKRKFYLVGITEFSFKA